MPILKDFASVVKGSGGGVKKVKRCGKRGSARSTLPSSTAITESHHNRPNPANKPPSKFSVLNGGHQFTGRPTLSANA